jgi:hypothetical protein
LGKIIYVLVPGENPGTQKQMALVIAEKVPLSEAKSAPASASSSKE